MIALALAIDARAGGFEVAQQSAIAGGTGHAGTARTDASAAWFAPAGLADDAGARLAVGAALAAATIDARGTDPAAPWQSRTETPIGTPPHLYASWAGHHLLAGVAANTAFAGGVRWPEDGPLRFESIRSEPRFVRIAPFVGGHLDRVRLAVGLHVDAGALHVLKATDHVTEEGRAELLLRGTGVGADASLHVALTDAVALAASYKGRSRLALRGEADFDLPPAFATGRPDQAVSATWRLPDRLAAGVSASAGPWRVLADAVLTTWSVNDALVVEMSDPTTDDIVQTNAWRDSLALRGGGERQIGPVTLRAGGCVDGVTGPPGPTATLGPSSPDGTRISATVGAGAAIGEHLRLDGFGEWLTVLARTSTSPDAPAAAYRGRAAIGGITASAAF